MTDTQASINPLSTQGKAFSGEINMLNNATLVKTWQEYDASGISLTGYSNIQRIQGYSFTVCSHFPIQSLQHKIDNRLYGRIFQCTLAAVSLFPSRAYVVKVSMEMITGVVAQKYTHQASRYFLPFKLFNSAALRKNAKL